MKEKAQKWMARPFVYGVCLLIILTLFFRLTGAGISTALKLETESAQSLVSESIKFLTTFLLIGWMCYTTDGQFTFGLQKKNFFKGIVLTLPMYLFVVLQGSSALAQPLHSDAALWVLAVFIGVAAGFFEEIVVRSVLLGMMMQRWGWQKNGIIKAALLSSLAFGLIHFANLTHAAFAPTLTQVIYATFIGIFFAAVYLRTHNLWGCMLVHALTDITAYIPTEVSVPESNTVNIGMILFFLIYALIGLFMLRMSKRDGIREVWGIMDKETFDK